MQDNAYSVRVENTNAIDRYFASFIDGEGVIHEKEVTFEVYLALESCRKHEKRQNNFDDRHVEQAELSEAQLLERMIHFAADTGTAGGKPRTSWDAASRDRGFTRNPAATITALS